MVGYTVAAANSGAYGGGMLLAPDASLDDGLLDVVMIVAQVQADVPAPAPDGVQGRARAPAERRRCVRGAEVEISADRPFTMYADGDPIAELPVTVRVLPGAVQVLVPA